MNEFFDFALRLLNQFAGGPGPIENNLVRFGLPAILWGGLLIVAWSRQREQDLPREKLLVWGFGLGFASALLMPENIIRSWWEQAPPVNENEWCSWVIESAKKLHVTGLALLWRFVQLGLIDKKTVIESERWRVIHESEEYRPRRFSLNFIETLSQGLEEGRISVRRTAALLDLSIDDLADLFREHDLEPPFDI